MQSELLIFSGEFIRNLKFPNLKISRFSISVLRGENPHQTGFSANSIRANLPKLKSIFNKLDPFNYGVNLLNFRELK